MPLPRGARWLLWVLSAVVVLVGLAWAALAIFLPPAKVRALVQKQVSASVSREVRFADVRVSLWPPIRVTIAGPAMAEPGGFASGTAFQAQAIHLDLNLMALLGRRVVLRRLVLDEPAVHVVLRQDGTTSFDQMAPAGSQAAAKPMDVAVQEIVIRRGSLLLDDVAASRRTRFSVDTRTSFSLEGASGRIATQGASEISNLAFGPLAAARASDLNAVFAKLCWKVAHQAMFDPPQKRLAIPKLAVSFGATEVSVLGTVDFLGNKPVLALQARGRDVDLAEILAFLASADARALNGISGGGKLGFELSIAGATGTPPPAVTGVLSVRDGSFRYPDAPAGVDAASFDVRLAPDSVLVRNASARVAGQPVRGSATLSGKEDPRVSFALQGAFDLAAVSRLIVAKDAQLTGRAQVDVRGSGRTKDPGAIALEGWAKLQNASLLSPALPQRVERIDGEFTFSPARAEVQRLSAHAGKSSFNLDATVTRPLAIMAKPPVEPGEKPVPPSEIRFQLRSPYMDLAELLPPTPGGPLLPNARGEGSIAIWQLKNKKLDVQDVKARVLLEPTKLEVPEFRFKAYGGGVRGKAEIGLADPARPSLMLDAQVDSASAQSLLSTWTEAGELFHGVMATSLRLSASGTKPADILASLSASGLARMADGALGPAPMFEALASFTKIPAYKEVRFRDFVAPFQVENGRVATGPARLSGNYGDWLISGSTGFDGSLDYAVGITVPKELTAKLGTAGALAAGALADPQGRVLLDLKVGGTMKSPRIGWDSRSTRDRLLGKLPSSLLPPQGQAIAANADSAAAAMRAAIEDSVRKEARRARLALEDSLKKEGRKLLRGLFGKQPAKPDTGK